MDIILFISGILTGGLGLKILEKVWDWKINEFSDSKAQKKLQRFQLSEDILKILNEGSNKSWAKKPEDVNHLNYIGRLLNYEDKSLSAKFDKLITLWQVVAGKHNSSLIGEAQFGGNHILSITRDNEDAEFVSENIKILNSLDKEITGSLKSWRT